MAEIVKNRGLKRLNTFGISADSKLFAEFSDIKELREILSDPQVEGLNWYVIGGGSNILLTKNYNGIMLHPVSTDIAILNETDDSVMVKADAGLDWDKFVGFCISKGYAGLENLSAIPGTVGASPVQNIGAYGVEVKDSIYSVDFYLADNDRVETIYCKDCGFGYRDSIFKRELKCRSIVLSVTFLLSKNPVFNLCYGDLSRRVEELGGATLAHVREAVTQIRDSKLPNPKILGNSGSFFKNPVVETETAEKLKLKYPDMPSYPTSQSGMTKLAAGWLIDRAGWKGYREGDAGVHEKQALVLVNYAGASGQDIITLAHKIIEDIKTKFEIEIEMEVNVL